MTRRPRRRHKTDPMDRSRYQGNWKEIGACTSRPGRQRQRRRSWTRRVAQPGATRRTPSSGLGPGAPMPAATWRRKRVATAGRLPLFDTRPRDRNDLLLPLCRIEKERSMTEAYFTTRAATPEDPPAVMPAAAGPGPAAAACTGGRPAKPSGAARRPDRRRPTAARPGGSRRCTRCRCCAPRRRARLARTASGSL